MTDIEVIPRQGEDGAVENDIPLFDKSEPRSLINIVWGEMVPILERLEKSHENLFQISERKLRMLVDPDSEDSMLRLSFWQEYDRAQRQAGKMMAASVTRGVCTRDYWKHSVVKVPLKLAFIVTPPPRYLKKMESLLFIGLDELEDILRRPISKVVVGKDGKRSEFINTPLIAQKIRIFEMLDLRVKGAVVQRIAMHSRIDQRTQIIEEDPLARIDLSDLRSLDAGLERVKGQIKQAERQELLLSARDSGEVFDVDRGVITETGSAIEVSGVEASRAEVAVDRGVTASLPMEVVSVGEAVLRVSEQDESSLRRKPTLEELLSDSEVFGVGDEQESLAEVMEE